MKPEVDRKAMKVYARVKIGAVKLVTENGVSIVQTLRDLSVHGSVLRRWVQECGPIREQAFSGRVKEFVPSH